MKQIEPPPPRNGAMQVWEGMPIAAKVVTAVVLAITLYYSFAILLSFFIVAAFCVGTFTIIRWIVRR